MNDAGASEAYVKHVLEIGKQTTTSLKEAVGMTTGQRLTFDDSDDTCLTVSLAILGFSIAGLRSRSPMMDSRRAQAIAEHCKAVFRTRFGIPAATADDICRTIDGFADSFESSVRNKENPIGRFVVPLLRRCLGSDFNRVTMADGKVVSPVVGDMVADLLTISLTQSLDFWKNHCGGDTN
jgi:hypothetical protein